MRWLGSLVVSIRRRRYLKGNLKYTKEPPLDHSGSRVRTVACELSWTLHGSTATPPRCAMMLVLFLVVNMVLPLPKELSTTLELVSGEQTQTQR